MRDPIVVAAVVAAAVSALFQLVASGLEHRRSLRYRWDEPRREVYGRFLVEFDRASSASRDRAIRSQALEEIETVADQLIDSGDLSDANRAQFIEALRRRREGDYQDARDRMVESKRTLRDLEAQIEVVATPTVYTTAFLMATAVTLDFGDPRPDRARFLKAIRRELAIPERAPTTLRGRLRRLSSKVKKRT